MSAIEVYEHPPFINLKPHHDDTPQVRDAHSAIGISSIVIHDGEWEFYQHANYQGQCWRLGPGRYPHIPDLGIPHDTITSFRRNWFWVDPRLEHAWDELDRARDAALAELAKAEDAMRDALAPLGGRDPEAIMAETKALAQALAQRRAEPAALKAKLLAARERKDRALARLDEASRRLAEETRSLADAKALRAKALVDLDAARLVLRAEEAARMVAESLVATQSAARAAVNERLALAQRALEERSAEALAVAAQGEREVAQAVAEARLAAEALTRARVDELEAALSKGLDERVARARDLSAAETAGALARQAHEATTATRAAVEKARAAALDAAGAKLRRLQEDLRAPDTSQLFDARLKDGESPLSALVNATPSVSGAAAKETDAREARVVLATVRDREGVPAAGVRVQLLDDRGLHVDETRTDLNGAALLRFPEAARGREEVLGVIAVPHPGREPTRAAFKVRKDAQHAVVDVPVEEAPPAAGTPGDPYERLPAHLVPTLFEDLLRVASPRQDPLAPQDSRGFSSRRAPVVRRLVAARVGPQPKEAGLKGAPARRYQVALRQEWVFVGYTLGEMRAVEGLRPGETLREVVATLQTTAERTSDEVERQAREILENVAQTSDQVDKLVARTSSESRSAGETHSDATTNSEASSISGGVSIPFVGGMAGSKTDAYSRVDANLRQTLTTNALAVTDTDATQHASSAMQAAQSSVNDLTRRISAVTRSLQRSTQHALDRVSPLLSRATNVMEWTLYENYLVCTRVEDVKEVVCERVVGLPQDAGHLFTGEDVVEYMRFFASGFLDYPLLARFTQLRDLVESGQDASTHPIVRHVNRNRRHYMGRLLNAALVEPSLRDDAPQLRSFGAGHMLWRLPILGFEGDTAVFTRDVSSEDPFATKLLMDQGTATLVQVAAPGGFTEVVQGLFELADLKGKVPPGLQPPVHVVPGDFKVLDLVKDVPDAGAADGGPAPLPAAPAAPALPAAPEAPAAPAAAPPALPGVPAAPLP